VALRKENALSSPEPQPGEKSRRQYCFGEFTLDLDAGLLRRGGEEVTLRSKSFEVLVYLIQHHGRLVTKTVLIQAVWPDTAVTDNSLAQCLLEIRRALGDDSQQLIRTMKRRGFMFAAPVTTSIEVFPRQPVDAGIPLDRSPEYPLSSAWTSRNRLAISAVFVSLSIALGGLSMLWRTPRTRHEPAYEQITNFPDAAVSPALSPDGRMVAFLRSSDWFLTPDPIYIKMLPDGEAVQLTRDPRWKYGLAFSPDGSRIAYTVSERGPSGWKTFTVPTLGGEPSLLLANASGVTWLDQRRLLFSEIIAGEHMGVVTATANRSDYRKIYFPQNERGMVHVSYASPDRRWALALEMDPEWHPCRLIPLDGSSPGYQVGPRGKCTSAAWSPDGKWMYFGVEVEGTHHLWRQRFPKGKPEQITFGPMEEDGVAVAPDGRSLITSIGLEHSALWIHDPKGDRPISSEGYVISTPGWSTSVTFSSDGRRLFYLMQRQSTESPSELWRTDLESGKSERVLPEFAIVSYDISNDGQDVVFSTQTSGKGAQIWLAPVDRSSPPKLIGVSGGLAPYFGPYFGPDSQVLFVMRDGNANYLARMKKDGSMRSKVLPNQVSGIYGGVSPDRRWVAVSLPAPDDRTGAIVAVPTAGGIPRRICEGYRPVAWAPDGKYFYIGLARNFGTSPGKTLAIPLRPGESLPELPASGIRGPDDASAFPGSRIIEGWAIAPGPNPSVFAYVKATMHRNLFRIPLGNQ
jgi:DNA-binding winged helix-turn-helix (wHTH) protein/Tol biopolymer transport system component